MATVTGIPGSFQKMGLEIFENYECKGQLELSEYINYGQITHLSLFSGIGGLDLAAEWAGITTVGQCEWADYPTKILEKHWPTIPRWRDIRSLTGESFYERTGLRTVDIISGGFPCQPFSVAGKQRGKEDDRYLWPEMVRVIAELRPAWVIGENVAGIVNMALDDVLSDLESKGYATRTFLFPAHAVGAPHRRYRTAIIAHANGNAGGSRWTEPEGQQWTAGVTGSSYDVADTKSKYEGRLSFGEKEEKSRLDECSKNVQYPDRAGRKEFNVAAKSDKAGFTGGRCDERIVSDTDDRSWSMRRYGELSAVEEVGGQGNNNRGGTQEYVAGEWWTTEPDVGRVAHGVPSRVDRLKCLGNAVVPQQFYPVFKAIAEVEGSRESWSN